MLNYLKGAFSFVGIACLCVVASGCHEGDVSNPRLYVDSHNNNAIAKMLQVYCDWPAEVAGSYQWNYSVHHNAAGTLLILRSDDGKHSLLVRANQKPTPLDYSSYFFAQFDARGNVVAHNQRSLDQRYTSCVFQNGTKIDAPKIVFDHDGRYFCFPNASFENERVFYKSVEIRTVSNPDLTIATVDKRNFGPQALCVIADRLYLFGSRAAESIECEVYRINGDGLAHEKTIEVCGHNAAIHPPKALPLQISLLASYEVVDYDPVNQQVLIRDARRDGGEIPDYYIYNIPSGKAEVLGRTRPGHTYVGFLDPSLIQTLTSWNATAGRNAIQPASQPAK